MDFRPWVIRRKERMANSKQVRKQLIIPAEMDQSLTQIAMENGTTASEIVRKALALYMVAVDKKRQGMKFGFVKQADHLDTEVIGL
jgi:hypothetical protein